MLYQRSRRPARTPRVPGDTAALFQMVVEGRPRLIYAGTSREDIGPFRATKNGQPVLKYKDTILSTPQTSGTVQLLNATPEQRNLWREAFGRALDARTVREENTAGFAILVTE